jgi:hypothetical protein
MDGDLMEVKINIPIKVYVTGKGTVTPPKPEIKKEK